MKLRALWALNYLCWYPTFLPTVLLVVDLVALLSPTMMRVLVARLFIKAVRDDASLNVALVQENSGTPVCISE
jgi:hypothetical protein